MARTSVEHMIKSNLREHSRILLDMPIRYSVVALNSKELKEISDPAVSVDISDRGLGILSSYSLEPGHVVAFENQIEMNNIVARFAIVKWVNKIGSCKYRAGLKFIRH